MQAPSLHVDRWRGRRSPQVCALGTKGEKRAEQDPTSGGLLHLTGPGARGSYAMPDGSEGRPGGRAVRRGCEGPRSETGQMAAAGAVRRPGFPAKPPLPMPLRERGTSRLISEATTSNPGRRSVLPRPHTVVTACRRAVFPHAHVTEGELT